MKRFKNILVVHDDNVGSDDALSQATELARANGARLSIVTVVSQRNNEPQIRGEIEKRLCRVAEGLRLAGLTDVDYSVLDGVPFAAIIAQVVHARHDIVIMSGGADTSLRGKLFGSTALHLMRRCPCPVWVMKPGQSVPFLRILAAVDPDGTSDAIDRKILDLTTSLASRDAATFHVVHAWDVDGKDAETIRSGISAEQRKEFLDSHEARRRAAIDELLAPYPLDELSHEIHLPRELPAQAIGRLVDDENIDLVVMGTAARDGIHGLLIGNAVEQILNSVDCSVLVVKPDTFVTPVCNHLANELGYLPEDPDPIRRSQVA